jgi:hypothetical protein
VLEEGHAAVKDEDKAKVLFETSYCNLYEKIMKAFACSTAMRYSVHKLREQNLNKKQKALQL